MTVHKGQERLRSACVACHRRKVRCVRVGENCNNCVQSSMQCRYALTSSSNAHITRDQHGRPLQKRRGPYIKGKTPREKELEDVVKSLTIRCQSLEQQLQSSASTDLASSRVEACNSPAGDHSVDPCLADNLNFDSRLVGLLPSPSLSPNGISAPTNNNLNQVLPGNLQDGRAVETGLLQSSPDQIFQLWHIYMTRVEPLTKLIPPSLFVDLALQTNASQLTKPLQALVNSVCLAAINSLSEDESMRRFNEGKDAASARFNEGMQAIEVLQQPSTEVLQALVLNAVRIELPWLLPTTETDGCLGVPLPSRQSIRSQVLRGLRISSWCVQSSGDSN